MCEATQDLKTAFIILAKNDYESGASEKQCWFLAKLCVEKGLSEQLEKAMNLSDRASRLTKGIASKLIDALMKNDIDEFWTLIGTKVCR